MNRLTHLNSLQAIEAAMRCGSLKTAAEELGVTPAAVGQRIRALEDYLGTPLLLRKSTGMRPTAVLRSAMEDLEAGFGRLSAVAEQLRMPYSNRVVISADEDWLSLWLKPRLARFLARYPELDVVTTVGLEADLTVTFRAAEDCDLLFRDYLLPVVSPENQRRIADIPLESRLEGFPLLHADYYARDALAFNWPRWVQRFGHRSANSDRGVRYARIGHAVEGVTSNAGILLCGLGLVLTAVESGELVLPFPLEEGAWTEYGYCLEPADSEPLRRPARLLREWLREEATVTRAALSARLRNRATSGAEVGPA